MKFSAFWPQTILLLGLAGCSGSFTKSTAVEKSAAEWIESGNAALAQNNLDQALADFNSAVGLQPDSAQALERRAAAYVQMKKMDHALYDCDSALKIDNKFAAAYFTRGLAETSLGNRAKAIEDFGKAIDNGLERADVLTQRGELNRSLATACADSDEAAKIRQKALNDFDRAVKLDPRQARPHVERAELQLDLGDYDSAMGDCDAALEADPNLAEAHLARARSECELGEIEHAITDCDSAIHLDGNLMEAYVIRAKARLENAAEMRTVAEVAECQQAVADCQAGIDRAKKFQGDWEGTTRAKHVRGLAHELRGSLYHSLSATKKALDEYERALSLDPFLVSALLRRAVTRSIALDYAGALNDCNTAIGLDSTRAEAYCGRGTIYIVKQEFSKAIEDFTQAVSLNSKCAKAYAARATVYSAMAALELTKAKRPSSKKELDSCQEKAKEYQQKSLEDATAAIAANRHLAKAYVTRGLIYAKQEITEKARDDFNAAIREDPKWVKAYYNRGVLFFNELRVDAAIRDFEEASKLQPDSPLPDLRLGQCYLKKGDRILSSKYFKNWQDKRNKVLKEEEDFLGDIVFKPKKQQQVLPDADMGPLDKAKKDLEQKLDATAEQ